MRRVALETVAKIDRIVASDEDCRVLPYVGLEHVEKDTGKFAAEFNRKPETLLATKFRFTSKHVLYGKLRPYLNKVVLPNFDGVCTTEILPILPCEDVLDRTFLWAYLLTPAFVSWASLNVSGANLPRLSPRDLAKHKIPLPPLEEQRRIAAVLVKADRLRQMRRYALQLSDTYLQSVFLQMFGDPVTNPMGWSTTRLGNLVAKLNYGTSVNCSSIPAPQSLPVLRIPNIIGGTVSYDDLKYTDALSPNEIEKLTLQQGDVLFVRSNGNPEYIGRCAIFTGDEKMLYASYLIRGRLRKDADFSPEFLRDMISLPSYRANLVKQARTTAGNYNINTEGLRQLKLIAPSYDKQTAYLEVAQRHERLRAQQREAARQADHLFDTLLHRAFRGELLIKDYNEFE